MTHYLNDEMTAINQELTVRRPVYRQEELDDLCKYAKPKGTLLKKISARCKEIRPMRIARNCLPLIDWISTYNWKKNVTGDLVAGITVAVMHIPQGMAYAILGNVPPIVGIYMAFFPVLVYFFLGTSRHNSMGTFALVCMMTGKVVATYSTQEQLAKNGTTSGEPGIAMVDRYTPVQVATVVTFTVALVQLTMYLLRLGMIVSLLADSLISGFITGSAIHVFTSQVKDILGLRNLPDRRGPFKLIQIYVDVVNNLESFNGVALLLSSVTILILVVNNALKSRIEKLIPFPIPIEMIAIVIGTILSVYLNLADVHGIAVVGDIPVGLPAPSLPPLSLVPNVLLDSLVITMVSYAVSMSMALIFARKLDYEIDSNQELMAQGIGNLVGSFFSCMPFTASLSRSLIQQTVGGKTQLASLISCGLLVSVLLWIGPYFEPLPRCVLASIIVVALQGMLKKITEFHRFWKLDKSDGVIWAVTFLSVILLDVEYGLLIGILFCIGKLVLFAVRPYTCSLALVPGTELYLDTDRYKGTIDQPAIKIFHYSGSLNFACRQRFRDDVYKVAGLVPRKRSNGNFKHDELEEIKKLRVLILDFSALSHIDLAGATALGNLINEYCEIDISVYISGCSGPVHEMMRKCNLLEYKANLFAVFPTVADAVHFAKCIPEPSDVTVWNSSTLENAARL
ncbi:solute carrier family 26 member 6-like [Ceratina calcarata]|uniref:Solute carrier family 26 member 6-like n=1 Tax=Ceratina calcarata TaxID=156304 RepID=A0AAJ7N2Y0_9HYME|nr:solute carrier family 26 member 6-like [Ceratina calcarata]